MSERTTTTPDDEKLVKFGTAKKMFQSFAALIPKGGSGSGSGGNTGTDEPTVATVQFDATNGAFPDGNRFATTTTNVGKILTTPQADPARTGYTFEGWFTQASGGESVDGITVNSTAYVVYFAHWRAKEYGVTLNQNYGASPTTSQVTATFDSLMADVTVPMRNKYLFLGYFDSPDENDGVQYFTAEGKAVKAWDKDDTNTILYAHWQLTGGSSSSSLDFDDTTGRYSNESISDWMNTYADGLVYGVQIPLYTASVGTAATKTDANAGLMLEPSTNELAGRNDYTGKKLFMCPRVNGGVDANGMPYVTAIEGMDDRFDCTAANTFALTPVYYAKYTETTEYIWQQYCDTALEGFSACAGAYTADNVLRPYILRACYMDSDGQCTSKSGTLPASSTSSGLEGYYAHCLQNDFNASRGREDGLTFLSYADITYQTEFMQLMLGVKAPKSVARGCIGYYYRYQLTAGGTGKTVTVSATNGTNLKVGSYVHVGTSNDVGVATGRSIACAVRVLDIEISGDNAIVSLDLDKDITTASGNYLNTCWYRNGSCDDVLGTYGCFDLEGMTDNKAPFRFQNIEWQLGIYEVCTDIYLNSRNVYIAPDVTACSGINTDDGWTNVGAVPSSNSCIKDYTTAHGARFPRSVGATSTTGYMTSFWQNTGSKEWLVGGNFADADSCGVGYVDAGSDVSIAYWYFGGRASTVGHSAIAE